MDREYKKPFFNLSEKEKILLSRRMLYTYGSADRDWEMSKSSYFPRFAKLTEKLLHHYAGEHYNPHTIDLIHVVYFRQLLHSMISTKVIHKIKGYDWEVLDNFFKSAVGSIFGINIPYDAALLEAGFKPEFRVQGCQHEGNETIN